MNRSSWEINLEEISEIKPEHIQKVCQCRRRVFTTEEDQLIADLVSSQKFKNWHEIAQKLHGRTARQCRDRWTNYLSPSNSFAPWTQEEDELIVQKVNEIGTKWSTIAKYIKGRSDNTIKNRWYSGLKKNCVMGQNGLYSLKTSNVDKFPASAKTTSNFNSAKPGEGKSTMRVKASPQKQKTKFAYSNQTIKPQVESPPKLHTKQPPIAQEPEHQLPFSQVPSEHSLNPKFIPNKCSPALCHPKEHVFQSHPQDHTIQFQCQKPLQIQKTQEQFYQQIPQDQPRDTYQVSQLLQASLPSIHQTMLFQRNISNQAQYLPLTMKVSNQTFFPESQASQIQFKLNMPIQYLNPQNQVLQRQPQPQLQQQQNHTKHQLHQIQQPPQKPKQFMLPELEMEMEMEAEAESQAEDSFWDRQIFNQVNDLNKDPFQIPELYGEWF
ncbi:hypothetical protein M9Y10_016416 [Tritrichomonas musculus]|uniref:Myb-like DNA-binding domain containing protein n=1 Tax=Tritrichomonas musculus TaxID=1915356 RepID=A0ABR2HXR9_9EUKA